MPINDQRQRNQKRNNETDTTNYHVPAMKEQLTAAQKQNKNRKNMMLTPCPPTKTIT